MSEAAPLVAGEHQPLVDEKRFEQAGGISWAAARNAAADGGDQRGRPLDADVERTIHSAQVSQTDAGCRALQQPASERAEPIRAKLPKSLLGALDPHTDPHRVALIAGVAQAVSGVAAHLTAAPTTPRCGQLARAGATDAAMTARPLRGWAKPPPLAATGADFLGGVVLGAPIASSAASARVQLPVIAAVGAHALHQNGGGVRERCCPRAARCPAGLERLAGLATGVVSISISSEGWQSSATHNA